MEYLCCCTLLQVAHGFTLFSGDFTSQAASKPPSFENGNLDRPKPGMLIPHMFCTDVQIPHHDLFSFSARQIDALFLWSVEINLYHNKAHILSRF